MKSLILERFAVKQALFGDRTALEDGFLLIDAEALDADLRAIDERIETVTVGLAHPGESTRIVCVKDVVQPRAKPVEGPCGHGETTVLDGVAVVTCGPIVGYQEGIIDMSGPGAEYCRFSQLTLLVLDITVKAGLDKHEHESVLRDAGLRAARWLALHCASGSPDERVAIAAHEFNAPHDLPAVAYLGLVLSQGLLHDTYILGRHARDVLPARIDPAIFFDTGVVSGNCVSACDKTTTYHYQNHPIVGELLSGHGTKWRLVGTVLVSATTRLDQKRSSAAAAVGLVKELGADGVVISKEGFGNPDADLVMLVEGLEAAGIATVALTDEFSGTDGSSQSLADSSPRLDAVVSTGSANQRIRLPAMDTVFGALPDVSRLSGGYPYCVNPDGSMEVEVQALIGATNELGFENLSCRERAP